MLPLTVAVPRLVPPEVHDAGGDADGPNTVNVIAPVGPALAASVAVTDEVGLCHHPN